MIAKHMSTNLRSRWKLPSKRAQVQGAAKVSRAPERIIYIIKLEGPLDTPVGKYLGLFELLAMVGMPDSVV
jgi:hypothetical protein